VCSLSLSLLSFCVSSVTTSTPPICSCRGFSDESIWCAPLCRKSKEHPSNRLSHNICRFYFAPRRRELVCEESNSKLARDCPGGVLQQLRLPARSLAVSRWATRIFFAVSLPLSFVFIVPGLDGMGRGVSGFAPSPSWWRNSSIAEI